MLMQKGWFGGSDIHVMLRSRFHATVDPKP
jgi:hypothetical protein